MIHYFLKIFLIFMIAISCQSKVSEKNQITNSVDNANIKYAKNLEIISFKNYQKIIIKNPINQQVETYYLVDKSKDLSEFVGKKVIKTPLKSIVVTSTTHVAMLELLEVQNSLIGFPQTYFISSEKTRARVDSGYVKELGNVQQMNTEVLLTLHPDLIINFEINTSDKILQELDKKGFNILLNTDWLEETPLGRAEWIKLYGALFSKTAKADSIFNKIENNYQEAKKIAKKANKIPTILSGIVFNDVWNLPAGKSFEAQLLKDANTNYLWSKTEGTGSLSLSIESVLNKAKDAEIWISPGIYTSKFALIQSNNLYQFFNSLKNNQVYSYAQLKGTTGGYIYFETAPTRPDLVLKDLIKIAHPELMRHYNFSFYKPLEQ